MNKQTSASPTSAFPRKLSAFCFLLSAFLLLATSALAQPTVVTDKSDYPPESTATITGSRFQAGEQVQLQVLRTDIDENSGDEHLPWQVTAGADGSFQTTWFVTADEAGATLQLTATGLTSGSVAQTTFTDDAHDGHGTMTVLPTSVTAGSTGNSIVFSFREDSQQNWPNSSIVTVSIPADWTAPQTSSSSSAGYVNAAAAGSGTLPTISSTAVSGSGPWTVTVTFSGGQTANGFDLTYAGGGNKVIAPTTAQSAVSFATKSRGGTGGTLTSIATSPTITVTAGTATKLVYTTVPSTGTAGTAFSVTVQSQDANSNPANPTSTTTITLSKATGAGTLSGTLSGTIGTGANSVTIATPVYSKSDTMTLTATATAGMTSLSPITSGNIVFSAGAAAATTVETAANGSGSVVGAQNITAGNSITVYAITRDANGNFVANPSATWSLPTITGGVVVGDLVASGASAVFSGHLVGTAIIRAVASTFTGNSGTQTVIAGSASKLAITSVNSGANPTAGAGFSVVVQSQDANGNPANVVAGTDVSLSKNTGTGTLGGTTAGTISAGNNSATISGVTYSKAESGVILTATRTSGDSLASGNSSAFTVNAGSATQLAYTTVPSTGTAGTAFSVTVQSQDANGNPANLASATTITLSKATGAGTLSGTLTGSIGIGANSVTISTPVYSKSDTMTLTATASGGVTLAAITSGNIVFSAGTATKLAYTTVPSTGTAGTAFSVTVQSQDANSNPANLASATTITLSKATGAGTLSGTLTGSIGSGANSVTISTPVYSKSDTMTLTATASGGVTLTAVTSGNIVFSAGTATKLAYTTVPSTGTAGTAFSVTVQSQDANSNPANLASATTITLSKATGAGTLSGTLTGSIGSGANSVTISTPVYSKSDTMTLTATASGGVTLTAVTSGNIVFSAGTATKLVYTTVPSTGTAGTAFSVTVQSQDANGNPANPTSTTTITLSKASGVGTLSGTLTGIIATSGNSVTIATPVYSKADTMTLTATATAGMVSLSPVTSGNIVFSPGVVNAAHSTLTPATVSITVGGTTTMLTVQARDANDNNLTTGGSTVVFSLSSGTGTVGTTTSNGNGTYTATVTSPTATGSGTFGATLGGTAVGTAVAASSSVVTYTPGAIDHYAIASVPSPQNATVAFNVTVTAQDQYDNTVTTDSSTQVTMSSSTGHASFGSNPVTLSSGTFTVATTDSTVETVNITATDANGKTGSLTGLAI